MTRQYLVKVRDKRQIEFLKMYGNIIHVTRLMPLVILETTEEKVRKLQDHPEVISVEISGKYSLALSK